MRSKLLASSACVFASLSLAACGGGTGSTSVASSPPPPSATMAVMVSDASSEDWAVIGVRVLSIALVPQGGGAPVTVYTAPTPAPMINLVQLDQLDEILGNVTVPAGTYSSATLTVSANAGDIQLTASSEPEAGFAGTAGATVAPNQIEVQHTQGAQGSLSVPIKVTFDSPLTVSAGESNALDLEVDLAHPAFLIGHTPPAAGGATIWAVDFDGPVRHKRIRDLTRLVLRHIYGTVSQVAADNQSISITRDFPALPVQSPETAVATQQSLQIRVDATNGTIFYDVDAKTVSTIKDFSGEASSLDGKYVRVAARYQQDGTLVAARIWASSQFNGVWLSPEGHVMHVNTATNVITVLNEAGVPVPLTVDANTQFFFRVPQNAAADSTPIGTGPAFLANHDIVRGFKVHASVVDPLAAALVAQSIDIETAAYQGRISAANATGFTYTRNFLTAADDYTYAIDYVSSATPNGSDANGNPITGFKWWNFGYPTLVTSDAGSVGSAIAAFVSATNGGVDFGGTVGSVQAWGVSSAIWNDPANPSGWSARWTVLVPTPVPLGTVATAFAGNQFTLNVLGGTMPVTVDVSTATGSASLAYQVDRSGGMVTVSREDLTSSAGLNALTAGLVQGAPVKVYGVPQADGTLKAYVLIYFTGMMPSQ